MTASSRSFIFYTHTRTHALTHSLIHSLTHSLVVTPTHSHSHALSLTLTLTHTFTFTLTLTLTLVFFSELGRVWRLEVFSKTGKFLGETDDTTRFSC